jgi:hypothetical protein
MYYVTAVLFKFILILNVTISTAQSKAVLTQNNEYWTTRESKPPRVPNNHIHGTSFCGLSTDMEYFTSNLTS